MRLRTSSPVRAHGHRALSAGVRPHAGADPEQPEQEAQDRPHRRLPPRRPVVMDRVDRVLTSKICVSRLLGVLAVMSMPFRDDILPVIVPSL